MLYLAGRGNRVLSGRKRTMTKLVTAEELAITLDVSLRTVREYTRRGRIPYCQIGRSIRFDVDKVLRAIEENNSDPLVMKSCKHRH